MGRMLTTVIVKKVEITGHIQRNEFLKYLKK